MSLVRLSIGPNSGSLTQLPNGINPPLHGNLFTTTKGKVNFGGKRNIVQVGQNKFDYPLQFSNVKASDFTNYFSFANSGKKWWVNIGDGTTTIYAGFAYIYLKEFDIIYLGQNGLVYSFEYIIQQI